MPASKTLSTASVAVAATPFVQYVVTAAVAIVTWSGKAAFLLPVLLFADLVNPVLKKVAASSLPGWLVDRPSGCGSRSGAKVSCNVFPRFGVCSETKGTGFPSGHCQSVGVVAGYVTRSTLRAPGLSTARRAVSIAAVWLSALAVMAQRVIVRCHTVPQALTGLSLGVGTGWVANVVAEELTRAESEVPDRGPAIHWDSGASSGSSDGWPRRL